MKFDGSTLCVSLHPLPPSSIIYIPPPPLISETKIQNGQTIIDILMEFDGSTLQVSLHVLSLPTPPACTLPEK